MCNIAATQSMIDALDKDISAFGQRKSSFSKLGDTPKPVSSEDAPMVKVINREVDSIHKQANEIKAKIKEIADESRAHKRTHMVAWAQNGLPDDPDDEDKLGIQLGDEVDDALKTRLEAVDAVSARLLSRVPLIETAKETFGEHNQLTEEDLIKLAKEALAAQKK